MFSWIVFLGYILVYNGQTINFEPRFEQYGRTDVKQVRALIEIV